MYTTREFDARAVQSVTLCIYMYTDQCAYCVFMIVYLYLDVYIKYDVVM